ncbi:MAG: amidohydrolase family protein [Firmicutes bacterium]|nr:amidohydrolase family protein [Bacillota bacterium]
MGNGEGIYLHEYMPRSELVVERASIEEPKFPVVDFHTHLGSLTEGDESEVKERLACHVERLRALGVEHVVNQERRWGSELADILKKLAPWTDFFTTFGGVDVAQLDEPDFPDMVEDSMKRGADLGMRGVKIWKNVSLEMKDKNGRHIPIDDPRLTPIWDTAAELNLPVLMHIADPVAFFRPVDRFSERFEELQRHPDWSFCSPELFEFEELMEQQARLLEKNPDTVFIIAHMGSYAENLGFVGECLDRYPNMYVDMAARLAELGRQPYTARRFFEKHQDRILFATDCFPAWLEHRKYYEFLETWNEYFDYSSSGSQGQGRWKIYGIGLDDNILEKVYNRNARKLFQA